MSLPDATYRPRKLKPLAILASVAVCLATPSHANVKSAGEFLEWRLPSMLHISSPYALRAYEDVMGRPVHAQSAARIQLASIAPYGQSDATIPAITLSPRAMRLEPDTQAPAETFWTRSGRDIMGHAAVKVPSVGLSEKWRQVLSERADILLAQDCKAAVWHCRTPGFRRLAALRAQLKDQPLETILDTVNRTVNQTIVYKSDLEQYGQTDRWSTLSETVSNGAGDCEDIAIVKYWMLRSLNVPSAALKLLVVDLDGSRTKHAVLVVALPKGDVVLDNLNSTIRPADAIRAYKPILSLSENDTMIYGRRVAQR